jgi:hypothetical protein
MTGAELLRFIPKFSVSVDEPGSDCWEWQGAKRNGYGAFYQDGKMKIAHRVAYSHWKGSIENHIDHLCHNRSCVNPHHLEDVTQKENNVRSSMVGHPHLVANKCKSGHDFTDKNTYFNSDGYRECVKCRCEQKRLQRKRKRGNLSTSPSGGDCDGSSWRETN